MLRGTRADAPRSPIVHSSNMEHWIAQRVPVKHLWDYLEGGEPLGEFLEGFPGVTREQAIGVLELAFQRFLDGLPHT